MQTLIIEQTEVSPKVILDAQQQIFLFEGQSRPENTSKFYLPILQWLEEYKKVLYWQKERFEKNRRMTLQFKLSYFHSTSAKFIGDILSLLDNLCKDGYEVRVKWFYQKEDTDMKESAEEYIKMFKHLSIKLVLFDINSGSQSEE